MPRISVALVGAIVALGAAAQGVHARGQNPPLVISSMVGRDLFQFYCATCHGVDGRGKGPTAASLRPPTPDLTSIARLNGGAFPSARIEAFITGDEGRMPAAHGSPDMPVWGPIFRSLDRSDARTRVRIGNLVAYIESIQAKE